MAKNNCNAVTWGQVGAIASVLFAVFGIYSAGDALYTGGKNAGCRHAYDQLTSDLKYEHSWHNDTCDTLDANTKHTKQSLYYLGEDQYIARKAKLEQFFNSGK